MNNFKKSTFVLIVISALFLCACERNRFDLAEVPPEKGFVPYDKQFNENIPPAK